MQMQKPKSKSTQKRTKDLLKTLRELENIATSRVPLQKKVDRMNIEMLKILRHTTS